MYFHLMTIKRTRTKYISTLKTNMTKENINPGFRWKQIDETRNHFLQEIKQNDLMSKRHEKVF